jgi:hypothetical protein
MFLLTYFSFTVWKKMYEHKVITIQKKYFLLHFCFLFHSLFKHFPFTRYSLAFIFRVCSQDQRSFLIRSGLYLIQVLFQTGFTICRSVHMSMMMMFFLLVSGLLLVWCEIFALSSPSCSKSELIVRNTQCSSIISCLLMKHIYNFVYCWAKCGI